MHPELFRLDWLGRSIVVQAYSTAMCLALVTIVFVSWIVARRGGLPRWRALTAIALATAAFPIGSRLCYWATTGNILSPDFGTLFSPRFTGFHLPGGIAFGLLTLVIACRLFRIDWWRMADAMAPGLLLGGAVMRIGCFLNGCCFGKQTSLPWGVTFPAGSPAHVHQALQQIDVLFGDPDPVHPTQLYELAAALLTAVFAAWMLRRRLPDGTSAMAALACYTIFRWGIHCLRATTPFGGSWWFHAIHAAVILVATALFWLRYRGHVIGWSEREDSSAG